MNRRGNLFPSPLWGGVRGGGSDAQSMLAALARRLAPPLSSLPYAVVGCFRLRSSENDRTREHPGSIGGGKVLRRRSFLALIGGAAFAPLAVRAQQPGKLPTIGFLGSNHLTWSPWTAAFVEGLHQHGWFEGRNVAIEYRWAEGRTERYGEIAAEFVRLKVDVVVTFSPAASVVKQATAVIPIVFAIESDPIGDGLVASLARPGGNATGLSLQSTELAGKRLQLLREVMPALGRLATLYDVNDAAAVLEEHEVETAASGLGIAITPIGIRRLEDIDPAFVALNGHADALYLGSGALIGSHGDHVIALALAARLPTLFNPSDHVKAGALMSYGPNFPDLFRRAADMVDKILHGTKPGDIPVEQPTKFDLVINLKTAKALGLTIPGTLLATADELIE
jgi:putative tryptophan/tyrosine transport system substrate-binding protein